jgi:hypothetical protein
MREEAEMPFGHLKRISDWTNCACVAKRCGKQTDPRTHRQSSPHEARRLKLHLARKRRRRTSPPSERGILQRHPPGTTVRGHDAASDAAGERSTRLLRRTLVADPVGIASDERRSSRRSGAEAQAHAGEPDTESKDSRQQRSSLSSSRTFHDDGRAGAASS